MIRIRDIDQGVLRCGTRDLCNDDPEASLAGLKGLPESA